ncbi:MAG TPA: response regulator transcription factor [Streptosporangiaceae bacterium]|nr:response regulator transcription factor [Streptosporangiaceae bacterium]
MDAEHVPYPQIRVAIASASALVRAGLGAVLAEQIVDGPGLLVHIRTAYASSAEANFDVVIVHCETRGDIQGIDLTHGPILFAAHSKELTAEDVMLAARQGVRGLLSLSDDLENAPTACVTIARNGAYISPSLGRTLLEHLAGRSQSLENVYGLTPMELRTLRLLARGSNIQDLAARLQLKERTVKHHLSRIYQKLGVQSATAAVALAYRSGMVV